jgi:hypothetical protein
MEKVGLAWEIKANSSQALQTIATLKSYGLLHYEGATNARMVVLTQEARDYLRAQQDRIKAAILKELALKPKAMATYWEKWGADRPPEPVCLDELVLRAKFIEPAARTFLKVYDDTIAFAGLSNGHTIEGSETERVEESPPPAKPPLTPIKASVTPFPQVPMPCGPLLVSFDGLRVAVNATLEDAEGIDKLIRVLQANKPLLPDKVMHAQETKSGETGETPQT